MGIEEETISLNHKGVEFPVPKGALKVNDPVADAMRPHHPDEIYHSSLSTPVGKSSTVDKDQPFNDLYNVAFEPYSDEYRAMAREILAQGPDTRSVENWASDLVDSAYAGSRVQRVEYGGGLFPAVGHCLTLTFREPRNQTFTISDSVLPGWIIYQLIDYLDRTRMYLRCERATGDFVWCNSIDDAMRFCKKLDAATIAFMYRDKCPNGPVAYIDTYVPENFQFHDGLATNSIALQAPNDLVLPDSF